jgi:hypothetical protein
MDFMFTKEQIDILKQLQKKYPNDMEYGASIRSKFIDESFTRAIPNDMELGKEFRKIFQNL